MKNRGVAAVFFILLVAVGLFLYWKHLTPKSTPHPDQEEKSGSDASQSGAANLNPSAALPKNGAPNAPEKISTAGQPASGATNSPAGENSMSEVPPATVMENMRSVFRLYSSTFGGNPVGTNPEITSALDGNNPKQIHFIQSDSGLRINDQGELIDAWGTPFFFHQLSGTEMEIHSAGPDHKMWTRDDLVTQ